MKQLSFAVVLAFSAGACANVAEYVESAPARTEITLFAPQFCTQWGKPQRDGVTMHLTPGNASSTNMNVMLEVNCFGTTYWIDRSKQFNGVLYRSGESVSLVATHFSARTRIEATGDWSTENGRIVIRFRDAVLSAEKPLPSRELVFRAR